MSPLPSRCGWRMRSDPASDPRMRSAFILPPNTEARWRRRRPLECPVRQSVDGLRPSYQAGEDFEIEPAALGGDVRHDHREPSPTTT